MLVSNAFRLIQLLLSLKWASANKTLSAASSPESEHVFNNKALSYSFRYKMKIFPEEINNVVWCTKNSSIAFAHTMNREVHITTDYGNTWRSLEPEFKKTGKERHGEIVSIKQNPHFTNQLIFVGTSGASYITEDCGVSLSLLDHGKKLFSIRFHPTKQYSLLALKMNDCNSKKGCKKHFELIYTNDMKNFRVLDTFIHNFAW